MSSREPFSSHPESISVKELFWKPDMLRPPVLDHVNCTFEKGHFYGIIGPNGSGKTSLIRHLLRLLRAQEGSVTLGELSIDGFRRKELARLLSYVPQNIAPEIPFSARETVMMGRNPYGSAFSPEKAEDQRLVEEAMRLTETIAFADTPFSVLSGGEAQRVLLARAFAQNTPWLILDEPISNLDVYHQFSVLELLRKQNMDSGKSVICVLHDINLASRYCDRFLLLKSGRVTGEGGRDDVLRPEILEKVYGIPFESLNHPSGDGKVYIPMPNFKQTESFGP
jgi:iron complex transport system ATP-binding protein